MNRFKIFAPMLKASMGPDGRMRLHGIASSTVKDRHGDTMSPSALQDMEASAANNLTIFLNHSYMVPEDVAGHVERSFIRSHPQDPDIHDLSLDIIVNEKNERAVKAWEAIEGGTQLGLSIGAMIPEGGAVRDRSTGSYTINHVELLETSLVGVPANPRSWVEYAVKSLDAQPTETFEAPGIGTVEVFDSIDEPERTVEEVLKEATPDAEPHADDPAEDKAGEELGDDPRDSVGGGEIADLDTGPEQGSPDDPSVDPATGEDLSKATVRIEMPGGGKVHIDTGNRGTPKSPDGEASQEALLSAPETEGQDDPANPWDGIVPVKSDLADPDITAALQALEPTIVSSLRTSSEVLKAVTRELTETKAVLEQRNSEFEALEAATIKVVTDTATILNTLKQTPVGRRTVIREANDRFESLKSVYGEAFYDLLKRS